jgi:hypothetical protein
MKIAPEYGSVITNRATFRSTPPCRIVASPKSTCASPGGCTSGRNTALMRLPPSPHGVLDHCLPTREAVLGLQPLKDPLGRMPLLLRSLLVSFENLVNDRQRRRQYPLRPRLLLTIPRRFRMRQNLVQRVPAELVLLAGRPLLRPFTSTSWRIDFHSSISLRTSGHLAEAAQNGADAPSCRFYELHTCALPFSVS